MLVNENLKNLGLAFPANYGVVNAEGSQVHTPYSEYKRYLGTGSPVNKYLSTRRNFANTLFKLNNDFDLDAYFLINYRQDATIKQDVSSGSRWAGPSLNDTFFLVNNHGCWLSQSNKYRFNLPNGVIARQIAGFNGYKLKPYRENSISLNARETPARLYHGLYRLNVNEFSYQLGFIFDDLRYSVSNNALQREGNERRLSTLMYNNPPKHYHQGLDDNTKRELTSGRVLYYTLRNLRTVHENNVPVGSRYNLSGGLPLRYFAGMDEPLKLFDWDRCWMVGYSDYEGNLSSKQRHIPLAVKHAYKLRYPSPLSNAYYNLSSINKLTGFDPYYVPEAIASKTPIYYTYPEEGTLRVLNLKDQLYTPYTDKTIIYDIQRNDVEVDGVSVNSSSIFTDNVNGIIGSTSSDALSERTHSNSFKLSLEALYNENSETNLTGQNSSVYTRYRPINVLFRNMKVSVNDILKVNDNIYEHTPSMDENLNLPLYSWRGDYGYPIQNVTAVTLKKDNTTLDAYTVRDPFTVMMTTLFRDDDALLADLEITNSGTRPYIDNCPAYSGPVNVYRRNIYNVEDTNGRYHLHRYLVPFTVNNLNEYVAEDECPSKIREMLNIPKNYEEWDTKHVYVMRAKPFWSLNAVNETSNIMETKHARKLHTFGKAEIVKPTTIRVENVDVAFNVGDTFYTDSIYPYHFYGDYIIDDVNEPKVKNPRHDYQRYLADMFGKRVKFGGNPFIADTFNGSPVSDGLLYGIVYAGFSRVYLKDENGIWNNDNLNNDNNRYLREIALYDYYPVIPINNGYIENGIVYGDVLTLSRQDVSSDKPYWCLIKPGTKLKAVQVNVNGSLIKRTWTHDELINPNAWVSNAEFKNTLFYYTGLDIPKNALTKIVTNLNTVRLLFKSAFPLRPIVVQADGTAKLVKYTNTLNRIWIDTSSKQNKGIEVLDFFTNTVDIVRWLDSHPPFRPINLSTLDGEVRDLYTGNNKIGIVGGAWIELEVAGRKLSGVFKQDKLIDFPVKLTELLDNLGGRLSNTATGNKVQSREVTLHGRRFQVIDNIFKTKLTILPARDSHKYAYKDLLPEDAEYYVDPNTGEGWYRSRVTQTPYSEKDTRHYPIEKNVFYFDRHGFIFRDNYLKTIDENQNTEDILTSDSEYRGQNLTSDGNPLPNDLTYGKYINYLEAGYIKADALTKPRSKFCFARIKEVVRRDDGQGNITNEISVKKLSNALFVGEVPYNVTLGTDTKRENYQLTSFNYLDIIKNTYYTISPIDGPVDNGFPYILNKNLTDEYVFYRSDNRFDPNQVQKTYLGKKIRGTNTVDGSETYGQRNVLTNSYMFVGTDERVEEVIFEIVDYDYEGDEIVAQAYHTRLMRQPRIKQLKPSLKPLDINKSDNNFNGHISTSWGNGPYLYVEVEGLSPDTMFHNHDDVDIETNGLLAQLASTPIADVQFPIYTVLAMYSQTKEHLIDSLMFEKNPLSETIPRLWQRYIDNPSEYYIGHSDSSARGLNAFYIDGMRKLNLNETRYIDQLDLTIMTTPKGVNYSNPDNAARESYIHNASLIQYRDGIATFKVPTTRLEMEENFPKLWTRNLYNNFDGMSGDGALRLSSSVNGSLRSVGGRPFKEPRFNHLINVIQFDDYLGRTPLVKLNGFFNHFHYGTRYKASTLYDVPIFIEYHPLLTPNYYIYGVGNKPRSNHKRDKDWGTLVFENFPKYLKGHRVSIFVEYNDGQRRFSTTMPLKTARNPPIDTNGDVLQQYNGRYNDYGFTQYFLGDIREGAEEIPNSDGLFYNYYYSLSISRQIELYIQSQIWGEAVDTITYLPDDPITGAKAVNANLTIKVFVNDTVETQQPRPYDSEHVVYGKDIDGDGNPIPIARYTNQASFLVTFLA